MKKRLAADKVQVSFVMTVDDLARVDRLAEKLGKTRSEVFVGMVTDQLWVDEQFAGALQGLLFSSHYNPKTLLRDVERTVFRAFRRAIQEDAKMIAGRMQGADLGAQGEKAKVRRQAKKKRH
jgi:hypothetical protein